MPSTDPTLNLRRAVGSAVRGALRDTAVRLVQTLGPLAVALAGVEVLLRGVEAVSPALVAVGTAIVALMGAVLAVVWELPPWRR